MHRLHPTSGSRRLPLHSLVTGLSVALALGVLGVALLTRVVPLTGRMTLIVGGPSMAPAVTVGSALIVEPVDPATLRVGDVVSIKSGPSRAIFTHRIVRIVDRGGVPWIETKGDANVVSDPAIVPAADALGRVVVAIPLVGYVVALSSQASGVVFIVALELLLLLTAWVIDPKRPVDPAPQAA